MVILWRDGAQVAVDSLDEFQRQLVSPVAQKP